MKRLNSRFSKPKQPQYKRDVRDVRGSKRAPSAKNKDGWEGEAKQYNELVGVRGHYYHDHVVIPRSLHLLSLKDTSSVLDLGCGQGVFARRLPKSVSYVGVDASSSLVKYAQQLDQNIHHRYEVLSATRPLKGIRRDFTHVVCILALQNMEYAENALKNAYEHLVPGGRFLIVLNHPAFRTPRQSGWGEQANGQHYRWVNRYMSNAQIPITMHPSNKKSSVTMSYHKPLSAYISLLAKQGFVITDMQEWTSDKESVGKHAKAENVARAEFPLFLAITAQKPV